MGTGSIVEVPVQLFKHQSCRWGTGPNELFSLRSWNRYSIHTCSWWLQTKETSGVVVLAYYRPCFVLLIFVPRLLSSVPSLTKALSILSGCTNMVTFLLIIEQVTLSLIGAFINGRCYARWHCSLNSPSTETELHHTSLCADNRYSMVSKLFTQRHSKFRPCVL